MRQIKRLALALCALAMALALAGCGESMTPQKLVQEMAGASREKPMTQMTMDLALDASMGAEGITMDMSVGMGADVKMSLEPYAMYMDMDMDMSMMGEEISEPMEIYMLEEDGEAVTYTYMAGQWTRQAVEQDMDALISSSQSAGYDWLLDKTGGSLVLAEEKPQVNGRETYMLTAILSWDDMMKAMEAMDSAALEEALGGAELDDLLAEAGLGDLNLSVLNFTTVYYIDAETYLPLKMEMDVLGLDVLLSDIMKAAMAGLSPEEQVEMDIAVDQCRAVLDNISYDPADIPALPPEAADAVDLDDLTG